MKNQELNRRTFLRNTAMIGATGALVAGMLPSSYSSETEKLVSLRSSQPFVHPGIDMNQKDLDYMKQQVLAGVEPWRGAYERLKARTQVDGEHAPVTHIRGGWGEVGGGANLLHACETVYDCAVVWYISREERYAQKALEIVERWSQQLLLFDGNDAKLACGAAGYPLCAGAEILRYHYEGWTDRHTDQLSRLLMGTFYPLLRFYFPQANGNWDAVIGRAVLSIAIFTDNHQLFDRAIAHVLHGPYNGSLFKYIYPNGQCQETARNLAHVQYGLLEYAAIARIAYTQGVDLFSLGNNRLALGIEYTMNIILGGNPQAYGPISRRNIDNRRTEYEYPLQHYTAMGVRMPFLERIANEERGNIGRNVLTAFREEFQNQKTADPSIELYPSPVAFPAGATGRLSENIPANSIEVSPGENLQVALNNAAGSGRCVVAKSGIHKLTQPLRIPSGTHLAGEGLETVLMFEGVRGFYAIIANDTSMHDVRISNLVIEGATDHEPPSDPNTGRWHRAGRFATSLHGIAFLGQKQGSMRNISLENVSLIHFSRNGLFITGAENLEINNCNISDNGSGIVPGPRLQHNAMLRHVSNIRIHDSRFGTSIAGCGIAVDNCNNVAVERCEIARNAWFGLLLSESDNITIADNLIEGNSASGIMSEVRHVGCRNVRINNNIIQYNDGYGIESYATENIRLSNNRYHMNGQTAEQENIQCSAARHFEM